MKMVNKNTTNLMKLSIICDAEEKAILNKIDLGFNALELTLGEDDADRFLNEQVGNIIPILEREDCAISSIGQWGAIKHDAGILSEAQIAIDKELINICEKLNSRCFTTGFNFDEKISRFKNLETCIEYFKIVTSYASKKNVEVCVYNCDWNNFILSVKEWEIVLEEVPNLRIKYDPSHAFYRGEDYLKEINYLGSKISHVHIKGAMLVDGERIDDPPVGLDQLDWKTIIVLLRIHGYKNHLSIEPHAVLEELKNNDSDIIRTKNYIESLIF